MRIARLVVDGVDVAPVLVAETYWDRLRGMLGRDPLPDALLLRPGNSVHGFGMRHALDVASLDTDGIVLAVRVLRPYRMTLPVRGAAQVLEAPTGSFDTWALLTGSRVVVE